MHTTQRYLYQAADLEGAAKALDCYDTPVDACVRVIYTSQVGTEWKYCIGLCVFASNAGADSRQDYPAFIFVSKIFKGTTVKQVLASLASSEGLRVAPDLRKPIDLSGDADAMFDGGVIADAELWLLAKGNALIDYVSTTQWPYKYAATPQMVAREEELLRLILGGESEACEFKPSVDLANDKALQLEKTVCAFSNQKGGTLFIGVSKEGDIEGMASHAMRRSDDTDTALAAYAEAVRMRLLEALKDNQCFEVNVARVAGAPLVLVTVVKSLDINFLLKTKTAYIRHGATSMKLTPPEMSAM